MHKILNDGKPRGIIIAADEKPRSGYGGAAALYRDPHLRLSDLDLKPPGVGMVQVRVLWLSVCGSDVHAVEADEDRYSCFAGPASGWPIVLGHEMTAEVITCGPGVVEFEPGQTVSSDSLVPCRRHDCPTCEDGNFNYCPRAYLIGFEADGVFATHATLPAKSLYNLSKLITAKGRETAIRLGTLAEPYGVALNALWEGERSLAGWGRTALIFGGGPIGCLIATGARYRGFSRVVVVEPNDRRRALTSTVAEGFGFDVVASGNDVCHRRLFGDAGPSVVFDACGSIDIDDVMSSVASTGTLVTVARAGRQSASPGALITNGYGIRGARGHVGFLSHSLEILADPKCDLSTVITRELHGLDELLSALQHPHSFMDDLKVVCRIAD